MRRQRFFSYGAALVVVFVVAFGAYAAWSWHSVKQAMRNGRVISPQGETLELKSKGMSLLVPVPLYPSARVVTFTAAPNGFEEEYSLYLQLATPDDPEVVAAWYLDQWAEYQPHRPDIPGAEKIEGEWFVTRKIDGRIASVNIVRAGKASKDIVKALREPLRPPKPGDEETRITLSVPWVPDKKS